MTTTLDLSGKRALVLGGTSGIGRALAFGMAEAGADVVASSRSEASTAGITQEIRALGRSSLAAASDVTSRESLEQLRDILLSRFGPIDVLVNCAGITKREPTLSVSEESWNEIFNVNLMGTVRACQIFGRDMLARKAGKIINIASLSTFVAFHEVAAYGASKAAIGALTRSLAVEWAASNVCVNAIAPGIFPTALNSALLSSPRGQELKLRTPVGRFGDAEELVSTAIYLASDQSSFMTGQIVAVDGGFLGSGVNQ